MSIDLYLHNQKTYANMQNLFMCNNKVTVTKPTGTGKSMLYLKWAVDHPNDKIIVLSPSNYIFNQFQIYQNEAQIKLENVYYMTYSKLAMLDEMNIKEIDVDFIILDEYHRCGASEWGQGVQMLINTHTNAKVLGGSATPIRYLDNMRNMAEELFNGVYAENMSFAEALNLGVLPTPIYIYPLTIHLVAKLNACKKNKSNKK